MGFSIYQFEKQRAKEVIRENKGLNLASLGLLNEIVDKFNSFDKYDLNNDNKLFVWISYDKLMNDFPFLSDSIGTYRNVCRLLEKLGFIEKIDKAIRIQNGDCKKKTFFRPTQKTIDLILTKEDVESIKNNSNGSKNKNGLQPVKEEKEAPEKADKKKKEVKKVNVDSNGEKPLEGQINDIEAIEIIEDERVKLVNEKITTGTASEELINIITNKSIQEVKEVIESIDSKFITSLFLENAFNKSKPQNTYSTNEKIGFNNFTPREYDYDALEKQLLGWE